LPSVENATWYAFTILGIAIIGLLTALNGTRQMTRIYHEADQSQPISRRPSRIILALENYIEMWMIALAFICLLVSSAVRVFWDGTTDWATPIATIFQFSSWMLIIGACVIKQLWWVVEEKVLQQVQQQQQLSVEAGHSHEPSRIEATAIEVRPAREHH
jgi:hypothetical protein